MNELVEFDETNLPEDEQTLLARIPLMAGSSKKAAYLAYRSVGFSVSKAVELAGTTRNSIHKWRITDPTFARWESDELERLQNTIGNDVIKFDFLRNMKLLLHHDMTIIALAMTGLEKLSQREYEVYKNIRRYYTPQDWLALEKILAPEKHQVESKITINLNWGNRSGETIDGESHELPSDSMPELPEAEYSLELQ